MRNAYKSSYFHVRGFLQVREAVDHSTACAIVRSRMDYCNALLLAGMSGSNLDKLRRVLNWLARAVTGTRRRDHIKPVLKALHCLPNRARISFKIAMLVHKVRTSDQPSHLADLIKDYIPGEENFSLHRWLFSKNGLWGLQIFAAIFITMLPIREITCQKLYRAYGRLKQ